MDGTHARLRLSGLRAPHRRLRLADDERATLGDRCGRPGFANRFRRTPDHPVRRTSSGARFRIDSGSRPYSHLRFRDDPEEFRFGVLADNAGGSRPGVAAAGVRMLDLLQPDFVVNLGDLIEGYTDPETQMPATVETYHAWWNEWDGILEGLGAPFFYVPGNHDINNPASVQVRQERFGGTRQYSHFRYKDVLFLIVSTEDLPKDSDRLLAEDPATARRLCEAWEAVKTVAAKGADPAELLELARPDRGVLRHDPASATRRSTPSAPCSPPTRTCAGPSC